MMNGIEYAWIVWKYGRHTIWECKISRFCSGRIHIRCINDQILTNILIWFDDAREFDVSRLDWWHKSTKVLDWLWCCGQVLWTRNSNEIFDLDQRLRLVWLDVRILLIGCNTENHTKSRVESCSSIAFLDCSFLDYLYHFTNCVQSIANESALYTTLLNAENRSPEFESPAPKQNI